MTGLGSRANVAFGPQAVFVQMVRCTAQSIHMRSSIVRVAACSGQSVIPKIISVPQLIPTVNEERARRALSFFLPNYLAT